MADVSMDPTEVVRMAAKADEVARELHGSLGATLAAMYAAAQANVGYLTSQSLVQVGAQLAQAVQQLSAEIETQAGLLRLSAETSERNNEALAAEQRAVGAAVAAADTGPSWR